MKKLLTIMTLMTARIPRIKGTTAYYYEDDYGNTWANCENLYDLPDYKATDNDDSGITVFFAPKAEKLTAMEKEYTGRLE